MKSSRKRKKNVSGRKSVISYYKTSQYAQDEYVRVARQLLTMAGEDPAEFDKLTKRTKQLLTVIKSTPYHIVAEQKNKVPRVYIKLFNYAMTHFEKTEYYIDPKYNISYLDYLIYGVAFLTCVRIHEGFDQKILPDQHERLEQFKTVLNKYDDDHIEDCLTAWSDNIMQYFMMCVSMPNYRFYTSNETFEINPYKFRVENVIKMSSFEPERKCFNVKGEKHVFYRLWHFNLVSIDHKPNPEETIVVSTYIDTDSAEKAIELIDGGEATVNYPVYIQNHALHRIRQRLDCLDNLNINKVFAMTFTSPRLVTAINGQKMILATDTAEKPMGYFPFVKQNNVILLLSFLPLCSPNTPEGSILCKELGIGIDDLKYIGLDKQSFYLKTDFETVPKLKHALQKANMWHLTESEVVSITERMDDKILKRFFSEMNSPDEEDMPPAE